MAQEKKTIDSKPYICDRDKANILRWIPNPRITNSNKALALAFAGCVQGDFNKNEIYWWHRFYLGAIVSYGYATDQLEYDPIFDLDIYKTDYITSTFSSAALLSKKWSELSKMWNAGVTNSVNTWKRGGKNGVDAIYASKTYNVQIEGICRVAKNQVQQKANVSMRSIEQWVLLAAQDLLPKKFGS